MKKYLVVEDKKYFSPSVIFSTDNEKDAKDYATILNRANQGNYIVASVIFTIGEVSK